MKLYQISTSTCPPCKFIKELIETKYKNNLENYKYIDITSSDTSLEEMNIARSILLASGKQVVPTMAYVNEEDFSLTSVSTDRDTQFRMIEKFFKGDY